MIGQGLRRIDVCFVGADSETPHHNLDNERLRGMEKMHASANPPWARPRMPGGSICQFCRLQPELCHAQPIDTRKPCNSTRTPRCMPPSRTIHRHGHRHRPYDSASPAARQHGAPPSGVVARDCTSRRRGPVWDITRESRRARYALRVQFAKFRGPVHSSIIFVACASYSKRTRRAVPESSPNESRPQNATLPLLLAPPGACKQSSRKTSS